MSRTLTLKSQIQVASNYTDTDAFGIATSQQVNTINDYTMTYGQTASDASDTIIVPTKFVETKITITIASSTHDVDLTQLVDEFGTVMTGLTKVYEFVFYNYDASGGSGVTVAPAPSNGWTGPFAGVSTAKVQIDPAGWWAGRSPYKGYTVSGTSKVLRFTNDAASPSGPVTVGLRIWGS